MGKAVTCGFAVVLALFIGVAGCSESADPGDEVTYDETTQELARCGPGGTCGPGFICRAQDTACHPACVTFPEAATASLTPEADLLGGCPAPFGAWKCCAGGYCAVSCP